MTWGYKDSHQQFHGMSNNKPLHHYISIWCHNLHTHPHNILFQIWVLGECKYAGIFHALVHNLWWTSALSSSFFLLLLLQSSFTGYFAKLQLITYYMPPPLLEVSWWHYGELSLWWFPYKINKLPIIMCLFTWKSFKSITPVIYFCFPQWPNTSPSPQTSSHTHIGNNNNSNWVYIMKINK